MSVLIQVESVGLGLSDAIGTNATGDGIGGNEDGRIGRDYRAVLIEIFRLECGESLFG